MDRVIEKALKIAQGKIKPIRFHQTIAQRGYSDGGAALTTGEPMSAPERPQTLALQMQQLANGKRAAVFVAKGSKLGNIPEDMDVINTREGDIYFNPDLISKEEVTEAATSGRLNELLDYVQSKPEALEESLKQGDAPRVVVSRDADGIEQDAAAVSPDRVEEQAEIFADRAKGGSTVSVEDLNSSVVRDRLAEYNRLKQKHGAVFPAYKQGGTVDASKNSRYNSADRRLLERALHLTRKLTE